VLGRVERPGQLEYEPVTTSPNGSLSAAIVDSSLFSGGLRETAEQVGEVIIDNLFDRYRDELTQILRQALSGGERSRTYTRLLGEKLIEPLVPTGSERYFAWDSETVREIVHENPTLNYVDFLTTNPRERPFLILGASMVSAHPNYEFPRLIPVDYTPLYSGVRQQLGDRLGGTYVWSWAYGSTDVEEPSQGIVTIRRRAGDARFTLADVIASSGAAPQLFFLLGGPVQRLAAAVRLAAVVFPSFHHFAIRGDHEAVSPVELPHGDGGFTDNLGLMPLLVRQVRNIIVFVNAKSEYHANADVESFFRPVLKRGWTGDKSMNHAFDLAEYHDLLVGFRKNVSEGEALVYCDRDWHVHSNELYNLSGYGGLNICWVYNREVPAWESKLRPAVRALLEEKGDNDKLGSFENFPWYETFAQNRPNLIRLTTTQVNLLANLSSWTVTNDATVEYIGDTISALGPDDSVR